MHVSECVLIMSISIFMIIASLLLFARSINLHPPACRLTAQSSGPSLGTGHTHTHKDRIVVHKAHLHQQSRGIVSHMQTHTHIQADSVIDIHPCECNHRRLSSPAVRRSALLLLRSTVESNLQATASSLCDKGGRWYPLIRVHQANLCTSGHTWSP